MRWITRDKNFYRAVLLLAVPIAMQNLVTFLVTFADNVMVGQLGDAASAGIYLGGQVQLLLQQLTAGLGSALLILTAQYWGKKEMLPIRKLVVLVLRIGAVCALTLTAASFFFTSPLLHLFSNEEGALQEAEKYLQILCFSFVFFTISRILTFALRSVESAKISAYVSGLTLVVNVALNWLFIFGNLGLPKMGVQGAALATLIARMVECGLLAIYVLRRDQALGLRLKDLTLSVKDQLGRYLRYGLPVIAGEMVWAVNILCQGALIGRYTEDIITAAGITNTVNNLVYVWLNGLWGGVSVIIGKTIGEGRREAVKEYARTCQILFLGVGLLSGSLLFFGKTPFLLLYPNISAEAHGVALQLISVLSITIIGTCYQACCLGSLVKAGGDTSFVFRNDTIFVFLVVLPSAYIAYRLGAPIWAVFLCLKCDQILKCAVAVVKVNRFRWIRELTH